MTRTPTVKVATKAPTNDDPMRNQLQAIATAAESTANALGSVYEEVLNAHLTKNIEEVNNKLVMRLAQATITKSQAVIDVVAAAYGDAVIDSTVPVTKVLKAAKPKLLSSTSCVNVAGLLP